MENSLLKNLGPLELFLIELILFFCIWWYDDYLGSLLSLITAFICFAILIISLIVEMIERSKVPRRLFLFMFVSGSAPLVAGAIYWWIWGGELEWLQ